jgi:hypothetical protein
VKQVNWSIQQAAFQFNVPPNTLKRKLLQAGVEIGRGVYHNAETIHRALADAENAVQRLAAAKLKQAEAEAALKQLDQQEREQSLVPLEEAKRLIILPMRAASQKIRDLPARCAGQCNPADPINAREVLEEAVREVCDTILDVCKKLSD